MNLTRVLLVNSSIRISSPKNLPFLCLFNVGEGSPAMLGTWNSLKSPNFLEVRHPTPNPNLKGQSVDLSSRIFPSKSKSLKKIEIRNKSSIIPAQEDRWKLPPSPPEPKGRPNEKPTPEQLQYVYNILQDTLPKLFLQPMNYRIYNDNVTFINNLLNKTTIGLLKYVQQVALLRTVGHLRFAYVKFNVLNMSQDVQEGRITVRWRIEGLSGLRVMLKFWKYKLWKWQEIIKQHETWYDGISYFDIGGDGLIYRHIADKVMTDKDHVVEDVKPNKAPIVAKIAVLASLFPRSGNLSDGMGFQCSCDVPTTSTLSDLLLTSFV